MNVTNSRTHIRPLEGDPTYKVPAVAWPTLGMLVAGLALWAAAYLAFARGLAPWKAIPIFTVAVYMIFTAVHEAVHSSLFRVHVLNTIVGNLAAAFMGPTTSFRAYRYLHLEHHRHTNDRDLDPDFWSGLGPAWKLPLRWLSQDLYYTYFYLRRGSARPTGERLEISLATVALLGVYIATWFFGYGVEATLYWVLPGRIAAFLLAITFNYLPHIPYETRAADDPIRATNIIAGAEPLMTPLFMFHNYHLIHHLFPGTPFYRYPRIWRTRERELRELGAPVIRILNLSRKS